MAINDAGARLSLHFRPLAHPTRRKILEMVSTNPLLLVRIANHFPTPAQATATHLRLRGSAGLLSSTKAGRTGAYFLTPKVLNLAAEWFRARHTDHRLLGRSDHATHRATVTSKTI